MIIDTKPISQALKQVSTVVNPNDMIPARTGVKITSKYLTAGNGWINVAIPIELGIPDTILDYAILSKAIDALSGQVELTLSDVVATLRSADGRVNVPVIGKAEEFPVIKKEFLHEPFTLTMEQVIYIAQVAAFTNANSPFIQWAGLMHDGERFYTCDNTIFSIYEINTGVTKPFMLQAELFKALSGIVATEFSFKDGTITAKSGGRVVAHLKHLQIEQDVTMIKPILERSKFSKKATIPTKEMQLAFKLLGISTDKATNLLELKFVVDNGVTGVTGKAEINTLSEKTVDSENEGFDAELEIGLNIVRFAKAVEYLGGEMITIELNSPRELIRITSDISNRVIYMMPMAEERV